MADNYLENHALDYEKLKAKRERQRQQRLNRYLKAYREKIKQQSSNQKDFSNNGNNS